MRNKTIKRQLQKPFLLLAVIIPLATLLLFNLAMRAYVQTSTRQELKNTIQTMDILIKKELAGSALESGSDKLNSTMNKIKSAARISELSASTDLFVFAKNSKLIYPAAINEDVNKNELVEKITALLPSIKQNQIYNINTSHTNYIVSGYSLYKMAPARSPYVVFAAPLNSANALIRVMNLILLCIMLVGISVGVFVSNRVSKRIAKPVSELCEMTANIGKRMTTPSAPQTDVSELAELAKSINEMSSRLEAYDQSQKAFLQNASHELRTPLMSIQGYAEAIASGVVPDAKQAAEIITSESKRLNTLVDELLTLSRIENQSYGNQFQVLNLNDMLREFIQRLGGYAVKENKIIHLSLPEMAVFVLADEALLSQAVINIASNCLRYAQSQIVLALSVDNGSAIIRVSDDGSGIDSADLPHLFQRFYKGKGGNFGLGLAIAKSAVEWMGGTINAYNGENGAVFEISLKLAEH